MLLVVDDSMTVGELEDRFSECFPYLKIHFYSKAHKRFEPTDTRFQYQATMRVGDIRKDFYNKVLEIKSWFTVAKVEHDLKELCGLNAQVFRQLHTGETVQTTLSDNLTLQEQSSFAFDPGMNITA